MTELYPPAPAPKRPSWDEWALGIAAAVATRGECTRRQIGAVIINQKKRQIYAGYNGAAPGEASCLAGACPRGRHYPVNRYTMPPYEVARPSYLGSVMETCACGQEWPCSEAVEPDSSYDTGPGACTGIHAELQCLLDAGRVNLDDDCVMYVSDRPCPGCEKIIRGYLKRVVWPGGELVFK
jgi:dCMP deaminase